MENNTAEDIHVGFFIDPDAMLPERSEMTAALDELNRVPGDWRHEFRPFLSLATLNRNVANDAALQAFATIPAEITLYGAKATAT